MMTNDIWAQLEEEGKIIKEQKEQITDLVAALEEIAKAEGPFSRDRLTHANNTIENMVAIASKAIAQVKEE